jgi:hypothetical protein
MGIKGEFMSVSPKFTVFPQKLVRKNSLGVGLPESQNRPGASNRGIQAGFEANLRESVGGSRSQDSSIDNEPRQIGRSRQGYPIKQRGTRRQALRSGQLEEENSQPTAKIMLRSESMPSWLMWLMKFQRRSSLVTLGLAIATLAVYGSTVYTQQLWNKEYRQLETLRIKERQLTTAGEVFKNQLADQAEQSNMGLVPATPGNNLFLPESPQREKALPEAAAPQEATNLQPGSGSVRGY